MRAALLVLVTGCYANNPPPPQYSYGAPVPPQSTHQGQCQLGADGQEYCGAGHAGYPQGYPAGYVGNGYPSGTEQRNGEVCLNGANGTVCGYDCKQGTNGNVSCAAMPGGQCTQGSDGHVYCTPGPAQ